MKTKVKIPSGRIVLEQNTAEIENYQKQAVETQQNLQNIVTEYKKLGLGNPTYEETKRMILKGAETQVRLKLAGTEPISIGGLKISAEKFREMLELPDLISLERALQRASGFNEDVIIWNDGEVLLNTETLDAYTESNTTYATTEAEKETYLLTVQVQETLQYMQDKYDLSLIANDSNHILKQVPGSAGIYGGPANTILNKFNLKRSLRDKGLA